MVNLRIVEFKPNGTNQNGMNTVASPFQKWVVPLAVPLHLVELLV